MKQHPEATSPTATQKPIRWINTLRGLCMMAILLDHTEFYYTGANQIPYDLYVCDALVLFFFVSGFLFWKNQPFSLKHKLKSILRSLLWPYFLFTTVLSLPKSLIYGEPLTDYLQLIVMGRASWFIAALAVAEVLFSLALSLSRGSNTMMVAASVLSLGGAIGLSCAQVTLLWYADVALLVFPILHLGYLFHQYEARVKALLQGRAVLAAAALLLVLLKLYILWAGESLMIAPLQVSSWPVLAVELLLVVVVMTRVVMLLPPLRWVEWTGSHSLVYYFLCGAVPLLVSRLLERAGLPYIGNYPAVVLAFALVYALTTFATWFIYRYLPFTVGRWNRRHN